jgi:hypothetical protein
MTGKALIDEGESYTRNVLYLQLAPVISRGRGLRGLLLAGGGHARIGEP